MRAMSASLNHLSFRYCRVLPNRVHKSPSSTRAEPRTVKANVFGRCLVPDKAAIFEILAYRIPESVGQADGFFLASPGSGVEYRTDNRALIGLAWVP